MRDRQAARGVRTATRHEVCARRGCARVRGEGARVWRRGCVARSREGALRECATGLGRQTREPLVGEAKKIERSKATMEAKSQGAKDSS